MADGPSNVVATDLGPAGNADVASAVDVPEVPKLSFAISGAAEGSYVDMSGSTLPQANRFAVQVRVHDVKGLLGIAAHLRHDPKKLRYISGTAGDLLKGLGYSQMTLIDEKPAGRLLLGAARFRVQVPDDIGQDELYGKTITVRSWARLVYEVLEPGSHELYFDPNSTTARSADGNFIALAWTQLTVTTPEAP